MDGFGIVDGDLIRIGPNAAVEIKSVDYDRNQITLKKAQSWTSGTPVFLNYNGAAPDIGYWESGYA
jgi:hypothetical protein